MKNATCFSNQTELSLILEPQSLWIVILCCCKTSIIGFWIVKIKKKSVKAAWNRSRAFKAAFYPFFFCNTAWSSLSSQLLGYFLNLYIFLLRSSLDRKVKIICNSFYYLSCFFFLIFKLIWIAIYRKTISLCIFQCMTFEKEVKKTQNKRLLRQANKRTQKNSKKLAKISWKNSIIFSS